MSEIKHLILKNILDINKNIYVISLKDQKVVFGAKFDDEIYKIERLIECTPKNKSIIEVAAYYLKNITILHDLRANQFITILNTSTCIEEDTYSTSDAG